MLSPLLKYFRGPHRGGRDPLTCLSPSGCSLQSLYRLVNAEARRFLSRRKFLEGLNEVHNVGLGRDTQERVINRPVPVGVGRDVRALVRVGTQIEHLGHAETNKRIVPNGHSAWRPLFGKHEFPVLITQSEEVSVVAKINKLTARAPLFLAREVRQDVVAVKVDLVSRAARFVPLEQFLLHVRIARGREQRRQPVEPADDLVRDRVGLDVTGPADEAGTRKPPSQLVFFSLRNGVVAASGQLLACGPLSVV